MRSGMYILYYIYGCFPHNLLFDVHVVLQMHGMLAGSLVRCIQGQVLAHWVTVCRWYDGWPQPSHPIISYPFQIAGLSILQHGVLRSVLVEQSCIVLQVFVHLIGIPSTDLYCIWFAPYASHHVVFPVACTFAVPSMRRYFAVNTLSQATTSPFTPCRIIMQLFSVLLIR